MQNAERIDERNEMRVELPDVFCDDIVDGDQMFFHWAARRSTSRGDDGGIMK